MRLAPNLLSEIILPMNSDFTAGLSSLTQSMIEQKHLERKAIKEQQNSINLLAELQSANLANEFADRLLDRMNSFDKDLDLEYEVGMKLVSFGQTITFHVSSIGYYNPSLIIFYGFTEDGNKVEYVQHVTQINFLLMALPRLKPDVPKQKIGLI